MQIYFHSRLCSYLSRVPILVEGTVYIYEKKLYTEDICKTPQVCSVPIIDFWGPYAKLCGVGGLNERMDETHLSVFTPSRIMLAEST